MWANDCEYCRRVHTAVSGAMAGDLPGVDPKLTALLDLAGAVADGGHAVSDEVVAAARAAGWDDAAIHDAVLVAAAFCMVNRYVDGLGARTPDDPEFYRRAGTRLAEHGYLPG
jgi:alkylhydroperoxidase family enzyme